MINYCVSTISDVNSGILGVVSHPKSRLINPRLTVFLFSFTTMSCCKTVVELNHPLQLLDTLSLEFVQSLFEQVEMCSSCVASTSL